MPASMISEETGSSWKVIGSSMAMVAVAPMPGSTPISVPSSTPMRQKNRFSGEAAVEKPSARLLMRSMARLLQPGPGAEPLERQAEGIAEDRHGKDRDGERAKMRISGVMRWRQKRR
jgi:hypothetical protein